MKVTGYLSACRYLDVDGDKRKGRSIKTWGECVKNDLKHLGLERDGAHDQGV